MMRRLSLLLLAGLLHAAAPAGAHPHEEKQAAERLRVCADPNNLPFSNRKGEGFENRIAALLAGELGWKLEYTWWAQRRGFLRNTLNDGKCDVVMGMPSGTDMLLTSRPYYRSSYVFVTRSESELEIESFDDPVLQEVSVGVHLIGDDYQNTPPAHALANRGIVENVVGFPVYGDYSKPNPPARLVEAVAGGRVDAAVAWGPIAGYFAAKADVPLDVAPVNPVIDRTGLPFVYSISLAFRKDDRDLKARLDEILHRKRDAIQRILDEYHLPELEARHGVRSARAGE